MSEVHIVGASVDCRQLLDHPDPRVRRYAQLMAQIVPILVEWHEEMMRSQEVSAGELVEHASNIAASIGATIVANTVPWREMEDSLKVFALRVLQLTDDAVEAVGGRCDH